MPALDSLHISDIIMRDLTSQRYDVRDIFNTLQILTLDVVEEAMISGQGQKNYNESSVRVEDFADPKDELFDVDKLGKLNRSLEDIHNNVCRHKKLIEDVIRLGGAYEDAYKEYTKMQKKVVGKLRKAFEESEEFLQNKDIKRALEDQRRVIEADFLRVVIGSELNEKCLEEFRVRTLIQETSEDLVFETKIAMAERLSQGIDFLRKLCEEHMPLPKQGRWRKLLDQIDVVGVVGDILLSCERKYEFPNIQRVQAKGGSHADILPAFLIETDKILDTNVKSFHQDMNKFFPQTNREKRRCKDAGNEFNAINCPKFIHLKPGTKLKKLSTVEHRISYGVKKRFLRANIYGFFISAG